MATYPASPQKVQVTRILVVDDQLVNRLVLVKLLKNGGYETECAESGMQALQALEEREFDLVLMDCHMPLMDGYETSRQIRDSASKVRNHGVPIVAVTADGTQVSRQKCRQTGMNDFLVKPVEFEQLRSVVEFWLADAREPAERLRETIDNNATLVTTLSVQS